MPVNSFSGITFFCRNVHSLSATIATAMTEKLNDDQKAAINGKIPAARMGTPEEIAAAVLYLASPEAGYVTGSTLHVNGGMAMI